MLVYQIKINQLWGKITVNYYVQTVADKIRYALEDMEEYGQYLDFNKREKLALKNYLNLSYEQGEVLTLQEFQEYTQEGWQILMDLTRKISKETNSVYILEKHEDHTEDQPVSVISIDFLRDYIKESRQRNMSIADQILEEKRINRMMGGYETEHMGYIELEPVTTSEKKTIGLAVKTRGGYYWSLDEMRKLAHEILAVTANEENQNVIDYKNLKLIEQEEYEKEQEKKRREEREEKLERAAQPKEGFIVLFQAFPSGLYKFSYSVKVSRERKIELLKQQNGDNVSIVHIVETHDTLKFLYQFLKKQYENRHVGDGWYELTEEDIEFFRGEQYPPQAMEWFRG